MINCSNERRNKKYKIKQGKDGKAIVITYRGKLPSLWDSNDDNLFDDETEITETDKEITNAQ